MKLPTFRFGHTIWGMETIAIEQYSIELEYLNEIKFGFQQNRFVNNWTTEKFNKSATFLERKTKANRRNGCKLPI